MTYLIDTNTVSYIVKGRSSAARSRLIEMGKGDVGSISAITEAEMHYGLAKGPEAHRLHSAVEGFLLRIRVLPWGREEARAYGHLRAELDGTGKALGNMDLLIAAHAIAVGAVLVTNDKVFRHVKELRGVESWAQDL
jgi:tRNA(fMet)-specific endonuclease VapC